MLTIDHKEHWENVYLTTAETRLSWYQSEHRTSLELIRAFAPEHGARIIDVGGGASVLVDRLLEFPAARIAVLDISETALRHARARLGERAVRVNWIMADLLETDALGCFDVWHDRAMFHFLTDPNDRRKYLEVARKTVPAGGHLILATFADDGPKRCSGLEARQYNVRSMSTELGESFSFVREAKELHTTPSGKTQSFFYGVFTRQ
jgi:2-polyprenyl-3-methyl-5-hydroxy-6-metoxy-1,4-benzoquinol methylase